MITRLVSGRTAAATGRRLLGLAIATAIAVTAAQPAWASWQEQSVSSPGQAAQFNGVSCTSPTTCVAVGSYTTSSGTYLMGQTSSGSTWTESDPANPPGATNSVLNGVSCSSGSCMAVGQTTAGSVSTLVSELWNGSSWTAESAPAPAGATSSQFNGVSCTGSDCVAVGLYTTGAGTFPLAESWNGSAWSIQATQNPAGTTASQLNGVSCVNSATCEAVGSSQTSTGSSSLAEVLSNGSWTIQATPTTGAGQNNLNGVSCTSSVNCVAVGTGIAAVWNGTTWSQSTPVKPPHDTSGPPDFGGVTCVTATSCVAAGNYYDDSVPTETVEQWNGTTWKVQSLTVADSQSSGLAAVACPANHVCTAVGLFQDTTTNADHVLVQHFSLSWSMETLPPGGVITSSRSGVTCGKGCTTAGTYTDTNGNVQGFVMANGGVTWVPRQTASLSYSSFKSIWCTAAQYPCVVVGEGSGPTPLAEVYSGSAFAVTATPLPSGATDGGFNGVSCTSASNCLAVGSYDVGENEHALAESWNGTSWSVVDPPEPAGSTYSVLNGVSCSATSCVAVGNYGDSSFNQQPLSEVYTSGSWTTPAVPLPSGASHPSLTGVSCPTTSVCVAVGQYQNGSSVFVPLAEKWNGVSWTYQTPPAPSGSAESGFSGIACTSGSACEAVGSWLDSSSNSSTLAEGLTGNTWGIQATPATGTTSSEFLGVACSSATKCMGVGDISGPNPSADLVEDYS